MHFLSASFNCYQFLWDQQGGFHLFDDENDNYTHDYTVNAGDALSQGPWTPWQMFSMGIIGFLAGILFRKGLLRRSRGSLATFGAFAAVIIYGGIMNPASAIMYHSEGLNGKILLAYYVSGLPMDLVHAAATVVFLLIAAEPMLEKLDRIKSKYGLVE